jgi:ACS family D-galactonate transporter-like MFS transporter
VATAAVANPTVVAQLKTISARDGAVIGALQTHPVIAKALAAAQASGATPTATQLAAVKAALGPQVFAQLLAPQTQKDLAFLSTTAPKALGPANFAALSAPTPASSKALATLSALGPGVQRAVSKSPKQWQKYFFVGVAGELLFIPLIFLMAGYWDPRKAKKAEEEHEALISIELAELERTRTRA